MRERYNKLPRQKERLQLISRELPSYLGKLKTFCKKLTHDDASSDDLVQSTCLRALERAAQFEPGTQLDKWICTIAKSIWLNEQRYHARFPNEIVSISSIDLPSHAPSIESRFFGSEIINKICKLPDQERMAVYLVYFEDLSFQIVAMKMGISVGTVFNRLRNARHKISKFITADGGIYLS